MSFESKKLEEQLKTQGLDIKTLEATLSFLPQVDKEHIIGIMVRANEIACDIIDSDPSKQREVQAMLRVAECQSGLLVAKTDLVKEQLRGKASNDALNFPKHAANDANMTPT